MVKMPSIMIKHSKAVFIDGMPILFMAPVMGQKTFKEYSTFLLKRKVLNFFKEASEVHVLFDCPNIWNFNLKRNVQDTRDSKKRRSQQLRVKLMTRRIFQCLVDNGQTFLPIGKTRKSSLHIWPSSWKVLRMC